ncbi:MAG: hypothetical protein ACHQ4J_07930 [Candidatus Binatia bacterium]
MAKKRGVPAAGAHAGRPLAARPRTDPFAPPGPATSREALVPLCVLIIVAVVLLGVFRLRAANPPGVHADSWTEANIMTSARNVATNGWAKYQGAAQHQVDRPPFVEDPFYRYAEYPLATYYVNWLLYDAGATTLAAWRWPPTLLSLTGLFLWYFLLCRFVGRWSAVASCVVMGTTWGFLEYADHVHHGYSNALVIGMMLCFVAGLAAHGRRRIALLAGSWLLVFVNAFVSWEWYLWSQAFYWGYAFLIGVPFKRRWLLVFALAPVLAFGIQSHQRSVAFGKQTGGGFQADFLRRTIRLEESMDTPPDVTLANYPLHVLTRFGQFYGIGLLPVCGLALAWGVLFGRLNRRLRDIHPAFSFAVLLLLCGVSWWCVMLQHTAVHPHVMRHALFFYALTLGLTVAGGLYLAIDSGRPVWVRIACGGVVVLVIWAHLLRSREDLRAQTDRAYKDPYWWEMGWSESGILADLARKLPGDAILLTNSNRLPLLRYWTNMPAYSASLSRFPFNRKVAVPNARTRIELAVSHLRELYGANTPRVLYLYFFNRPPNAAYQGDRILWRLMDGSWAERPDATRIANFHELIHEGRFSSAYPLVARGEGWLCFDAGTLFLKLAAEFNQMPPPTRSDFGPPR